MERSRFDQQDYFRAGYLPNAGLKRQFSVPYHVRLTRWALAREARRKMTGDPDLWECDRTRVSWYLLLGHWVGRGFFTYEGFMRQVEAFIEAVPVHPSEPVPDCEGLPIKEVREIRRRLDTWDKAALRKPLSRFLTSVVKGWTKEETRANRAAFAAQIEDGRAKQAMRDCVVNKLCPQCGEDVAEKDVCGHGFFGCRLTGNGTIEQVVTS